MAAACKLEAISFLRGQAHFCIAQGKALLTHFAHATRAHPFSIGCNAGGLQSLPKAAFPGGGIIGCSAGFLNVPKIKGTHTAMKTGMLAADGILSELDGQSASESGPLAMSAYQRRLDSSWVMRELEAVRHILHTCACIALLQATNRNSSCGRLQIAILMSCCLSLTQCHECQHSCQP